jgi:hypothetical protein
MSWLFRSLPRVIADLYNWLLPLVTINILWFVLSLTLVLLPPATAALYEIAFQANGGREPYVRDYLSAMRKWFVKSWIWASITLWLVLVSISSITFYDRVGNVLLIASILLTGFVGLVQLYFWPYMLFQEHPRITTAFRNAALTVLGDPLFALSTAGITILLVTVSVLLIAPIVVFTPIVVAFLGIYNLRAWLEHKALLPVNNTELDA